jgi:hypothetical protein
MESTLDHQGPEAFMAGDIPQSTRWKDLYEVAMDESNTTRLPLLLDDAINAVLDQIEDTLTRPRRQLTELNSALADLQLRRKQLAYHRNAHSPGNRKAA